ncbi:MAG: hypothetical protein IPF54_10890 [Draconibacterium sp.]|nr:hypothetical protein [Draconibacterium sp.]
MKPLILPILMVIFALQPFFSQAQENPSRVDISAGFSIPETFNLGGRWQYNNNGSLHLKLGSNFNINDIYYSAMLITVGVLGN